MIDGTGAGTEGATVVFSGIADDSLEEQPAIDKLMVVAKMAVREIT
ncbi:MAG TPA: hypothetical protein ACQGQI_10630 [Xylella sp.]